MVICDEGVMMVKMSYGQDEGGVMIVSCSGPGLWQLLAHSSLTVL
jgi:hypothetical protein